VWLEPGHEIEVTIEGLGTIADRVVAEKRGLDGWPGVPPPAKEATLS